MSAVLKMFIWPLLLLAQLQFTVGFEMSTRCDKPEPLLHGTFRMRRIFVRFSCNRGYTLQGPTIFLCQNGRFKGERPVCAKRGCVTYPNEPEHGTVDLERGLKAILTCDDGYLIAGNHYTYCDGLKWDRPLGICRKRNVTHSYFCDFETEDMCGWTTDEILFTATWKRVIATNMFTSYRTGPQHDHTTKTMDGGHYMLLESISSSYLPQHLISPTYSNQLSLKTACCFRFHYFMYGAGVGKLDISVKPKSVSLEAMWSNRDKYVKFHLEGNQNNNWNEHTISIDEMQEDFNVVISTSGARNHLGDIAIDDVQLMTGNDCPSMYASTTQATIVEQTEMAFYDSPSCVGRCGQSTDQILKYINGKIFRYCNCHSVCEMDDSCCLDYTMTCGYLETETLTTTEKDFTTTEKATAMTTKSTTTTTTTRKPIIITTSTTTLKPTTTTSTSTTTTTTTRKPTTTTSTSTTTTTTTRKPPTTTSTTTTTRKPTTTTTIKTTTQNGKTTATTTSTTTSSRTQPTTQQIIIAVTTPKPIEHKIWKVTPEDLKGKDTTDSSGSRPMFLVLLVIVAVICAASVAYRWKNIRGYLTNETGDCESDSIIARFSQRIKNSTQEKFSEFRDRSRQHSSQKNRDSMNECLFESDYETDRSSISLHNNISEL